jgi:hypothetical protein
LKSILIATTAALLLQGLAVRAADEPVSTEETKAVTNTLERFHTRRANCHWTEEMGKYMFECLKANFNMNAHWCHNEAMALYCSDDQAKAGESARPAN